MSSRAQSTGSQLPSGTVTFLFTDIERSTEHLAALGNDAYADALDLHRRLLRDAFGAHGGHEIGTEGDSFFVAFGRAHDAVDAASSGQRSLGGHPLRVRIGIHTGEALVRQGGYVGHDVHKAKRISDAGHGGQVLVSQTTADLVRDRVHLVDLGPHRLKDLGEPERIFQVGEGGFPPLRSLESFRHTLPSQRSSFIGREREIATLTGLLQENRLVTIHGVGGCGKTRLAVQVGAELLDGFPDGVFFADLAPVADVSALAPAVAGALGVPATPGPITGIQQTDDEGVLRFIGDRRSMLILDNCEHLLDQCASLADRMLDRCPNLSILATSREALQVDGEHAWRLPSLSLPEDEHIADSEAVSLFAARARATGTGFELTQANASAVAEICRRLDGIPLAIEFAAARVTHLSPRQIAEKLDDRFRLLTGGRRHVQRQHTLQAALDWSYDLLEEDERVVLRRLAVFPADFSLEAAEGICTDGTTDIVELLGSLVGKSLVDADRSGEAVRYRLLETVRAYAADRLALAGEARELRDRHRDWFLAWLESSSWDESLGYGRVSAHLREVVDLRTAIEWAWSDGRLDLVARMAPRLSMIAAVSGLADDLPKWCGAALDGEVAVDPTIRAACMLMATAPTPWDVGRIERLEDVLSMGNVVPPPIRSMTLAMHGLLTGVLGQLGRNPEQVARSRGELDQALELAVALRPDFRLAIQVLHAMNEMDLGNVEGAVDTLEDAMTVLAALPPHAADAARLALSFYLGAALYAAGEQGRAGALMAETFRLSNAISPGVFEGAGFLGAGAAALAAGDLQLSADVVRTAVKDIRRSHVVRALEAWVSGAAGVLTVGGDHERAAILLSWVRSRTLERGLPHNDPGTFVVERRNVRIVRDALGPDAAMRCRIEGRALTEDQAIAMALEGLEAL